MNIQRLSLPTGSLFLGFGGRGLGEQAWKIVNTARPRLNYCIDFQLLEQIRTMRANTTLMQTLGGDAVLEDIIAKNIPAPCHTCENNKNYLEKMDEYLKSVAYFVTTFGKNQGGNRSAYVFSSGITSNSQGQVNGAVYMLKVLNQNPRPIQNTNTAIFEYNFDACNPDILEGNKIFEFKSWSPVGRQDEKEEDDDQKYDRFQSSFWNFERGYTGYAQFLCYLRNIRNLDELVYVFDKEKIEKNGEADAEAFVKEKFQNLFNNKQNDVFEVIWNNNTGGANNTGLRGSLFPNLNKADAKNEFARMIMDLDDDLFGFIKVK